MASSFGTYETASSFSFCSLDTAATFYSEDSYELELQWRRIERPPTVQQGGFAVANNRSEIPESVLKQNVKWFMEGPFLPCGTASKGKQKTSQRTEPSTEWLRRAVFFHAFSTKRMGAVQSICLWKQHLSYWRSPKYNLTRLLMVIASSFLSGLLLWQKGQKIGAERDLFNVIGSLYVFTVVTGLSGCTSVLPLVAAQQIVVYRERFAGMYSSWADSLSRI
ncbi:hypothetical protein SLEP1_g39260 [Rubroshorea leprosula]|uniref:ABC-2 type transporter transmembrane domain-containing protein n=1 Tax=Rubroshorea leprosula TaxID=152421 RepID=A0AAV5L027_9ROSI|nr:hypothetical protein SLEP1_g39260 [Rubroshorea leprosula]